MIGKKIFHNKKGLIFTTLLLIGSFQLIFLNTISLFFPNYNYGSYFSEDELNSSSNGITINTPENKTYTKMISGYYPATFGFENDESWELPEDWISVYAYHPIRYVLVKDDFEGHNKVLDFWCNSWGEHASIYQIFENGTQEYGTIEFWVIEDMHYNFYIELRASTSPSSEIIKISIDRDGNNKFEYYNGTIYQEFASGQFSDETWFHMRIDFECDTNGYQGLDPDHFNLYLNGIKVVDNAPFWRTTDFIHNIIFTTGYNSGFVVDAVGYSWDPNYNIGDNLNEGLLLSFSSQEELDWITYSLNSQLNKTISGNSSIVMPETGINHIQVFANDTLGSLHESNIQYFTIDLIPPIKIITPENKTYTEGMNGYYHATHGFESDLNEHFPNDWQDNTFGNSYAKVIAGDNGHNKVVEIYSEGAGDYEDIQQFFGINPNSGTVEFWIRFPDNTKTRYTHLKQIGTNMIYIEWAGDGVIRTYDGSSLTTYNGNQWYHVKIIFDAPFSWAFYLDGSKIGEYDFQGSPSYLASFQLLMDSDDIDNYLYFDALGYSWDNSYTVGDNREEGILVSYETVTIFEWIGYSLNGETNQTIIGNFTIPYSKSGHHTIRIHALDEIGNSYESELRDFCIRYCQQPDETSIPGFNLIIFINIIWITMLILGIKRSRNQK
ncbi:MAG: hypothetical protein KAX18_03090 [Candidatus Lokiarchaeota archaeon]|nr:hypothetical protein [Candidatus Lokiarchaeota archaeon]